MKVTSFGSRALLLVLALVLVVSMGLTSGCGPLLQAKEPSNTPDEPEVTPDPPSAATQVVLYFADFQAQNVIPEGRRVEVVGDETLAETVVRELIGGPEDPHLYRTLPEDTEILSVELVDGVAFVNFSREVQQIAGSAGETMAIRSLVYSLTELHEVNRVQILIDGKSSESLGGHFVLEEPIERGPIILLTTPDGDHVPGAIPHFFDEERAIWLQRRVLEKGLDNWRTDPVEVARFDGRMAGFTAEDEFELLEMNMGEAWATVLATHGSEEYVIRLVQPCSKGEKGIWMIESVLPR